MKNPLIYVFALIMSVASLTSCSSDDDNGSVSKSREIKYELTGSTTATDLSATYTANGGGTVADITSLPWSYSYTADADTAAGGFSVSSGTATPGDKVTLTVYQGSTKLKSVEATATSDGIIVATVSAVFN